MKQTYTLLVLFLISITCFGQNHWNSYNNQPIESMTNWQTDKSYQEKKGFSQTVNYYPNGYIKSTISNYGDETSITKFYIYNNEILTSILEKEISKNTEEPSYTLELVEKTHKNYLPLTSKKFVNYDVTSETNEGNTAVVNYEYDEENRMVVSNQQYNLGNENKAGQIYKINYNGKDFITNTFYKSYEYVAEENDSIYKALDNTSYETINKSKVGVTKYNVVKEDGGKSYFNIDYKLYKSAALAENFNYLKLEDVYDFYLDEIIVKDKISDYTYKVVNNWVNNEKHEKPLINEGALQEEEWYINKFYSAYIAQELKNKNLENYLSATRDALKNEDYFELAETDKLRLNAFNACLEDKDYATAEEFLQPLYHRAKMAYRSNPSEENGQFLGLMAKVSYLQNNNAKGDQIINECNDYKVKLNRLTEESTQKKIDYHKYNYFLAKVYEAKSDVQESKKLLEENLSYYNSLEKPYNKKSEPFLNDYMRNKKMLVSLNTPAL